MNRIGFPGLRIPWPDSFFRSPDYQMTCGRRPRLQNLLVEEHEDSGTFQDHRFKANLLNRIIADS